jgi:hypothetical protein
LQKIEVEITRPNEDKQHQYLRKNWEALQSGKYIINSGSSRSSKTFSILDILVISMD